MVNAKGVLKPPAHSPLRKGDQPFWDGVLRARSLDEWTEVDLAVAAQLARCQADIEREQTALDAEGSTLVNERGTPVVNPRVSVLEQFSRRQLALMRNLRIGGAALGDPRDLVNKRTLERNARKLSSRIEEDGLLA